MQESAVMNAPAPAADQQVHTRADQTREEPRTSPRTRGPGRGPRTIRKRLTLAASLVIAVFATLFGAAPHASAHTLVGGCSTTGSLGGVNVKNFNGPTDRINLTLNVADTSRDGHHVAVRLVTEDSNGTSNYWRWHAIYGGKGSTRSWSTHAYDASGIFYVGVQVGTFEGSKLLHHCGRWTDVV